MFRQRRSSFTLPAAILTAAFALLLFAPTAFAKTAEVASSSAPTDQWVNVRVSPLGTVIGWINFDIDFKVADNFTVGPTLTYFNLTGLTATTNADSISIKITRYGVRGNYYFDGAFNSGWYITPMAALFNETVSATSGTLTGTAKVNGVEATLLGGYHWFWGSGFNLSLGAGITSVSVAGTTRVTYSDGTTSDIGTYRTTGGTLDFMLGWAF